MSMLRGRVGRTTGVVGSTLVLLASACSPSPGGDLSGPGVLLVVIDGLRADHVSGLGYDRPTTPALDELAEDGVFFSQAFATAPLTLPSHVSIFTGCDPTVAQRFLRFEGEDERRWRIPAEVPHLARELLAAGYQTAAFLDDPLLDPVFGFGAGFQDYEILDEDDVWPRGRTATLMRQFRQWLQARDHGEPWFAYLHLSDLERSWVRPDREWDEYFRARPELADVPPVAHTDSVFFAVPYSRWRGGSRTVGQYEASYDGHLKRLDESLKDLFAHLRGMGRYEETTIAVVGSFGVQFGEAGLYLRAGRYSMADLHVPWVLRPRHTMRLESARGRRVDAVASLIDVAPTLLALEGLSEPRGMHGVSQAPWVVGPPPEEPIRRYAFAAYGLQTGCVGIDERNCLEYVLPGRLDDQALRRSWFGEGAVESEMRVRFYDRTVDPFPTLQPNDWLDGDDFHRLRMATGEWIEDMKNTRLVLQDSWLVSEKVDEETIQELREKDYLGDS